jgi:hypothetical protein
VPNIRQHFLLEYSFWAETETSVFGRSLLMRAFEWMIYIPNYTRIDVHNSWGSFNIPEHSANITPVFDGRVINPYRQYLYPILRTNRRKITCTICIQIGICFWLSFEHQLQLPVNTFQYKLIENVIANQLWLEIVLSSSTESYSDSYAKSHV